MHLAAQCGQLDVLTDMKRWNVDLSIVTPNGLTPLKLAVCKPHLPTAQHLILLGAQVRPEDFPPHRVNILQQLMAWADGAIAAHHEFLNVVLIAMLPRRPDDQATVGTGAAAAAGPGRPFASHLLAGLITWVFQ